MKKRAKKAAATGRVRTTAETRRAARSAASTRAAELFVRGVLARGEAARTADATLGPRMTHQIVGRDKAGRPVLRRRRFFLA